MNTGNGVALQAEIGIYSTSKHGNCFTAPLWKFLGGFRSNQMDGGSAWLRTNDYAVKKCLFGKNIYKHLQTRVPLYLENKSQFQFRGQQSQTFPFRKFKMKHPEVNPHNPLNRGSVGGCTSLGPGSGCV